MSYRNHDILPVNSFFGIHLKKEKKKSTSLYKQMSIILLDQSKKQKQKPKVIKSPFL